MGKADRTLQSRIGFASLGAAISIVATTVLTPVWAATDAADTAEEDEVDPVAVAGLMIADKHFDRAKSVLESVDLKSPPSGFDKARYHLLHGLVLLELGEFAGAKKALKASVEAGQTDKTVHLFAAQAAFNLKEYGEAVAALERAGSEATKVPGGYLLRAECHWRAGEQPLAFEALNEGLKAFRGNEEMIKARIMLLVDMGLFQTAMEEGLRYLSKEDASADEYTALAEALIEGRQLERAAILLETARLRFPDDSGILIQLAKSYLENGHTLVGARLFEHASHIDPKLTADAAELYRRAGRTGDAVRLNAKIVDQNKKIRQRLGLMIETERYEEAAALAPRLQRLGLLEEDAVVYGLAYSYFMVGRFKESERYLKRISDGVLFDKAVQLRKIMGTCKVTGRQCP